MKFKCRKCGIVFTIPNALPSDVTALNTAPCGAGYGNFIIENGIKIIVHEIKGVI